MGSAPRLPTRKEEGADALFGGWELLVAFCCWGVRVDVEIKVAAWIAYLWIASLPVVVDGGSKIPLELLYPPPPPHSPLLGGTPDQTSHAPAAGEGPVAVSVTETWLDLSGI